MTVNSFSSMTLLAIAAFTSISAHASVRSDFNGDGVADLAIGAPNEVVSGLQNAGAVHVLYGPSKLAGYYRQPTRLTMNGAKASEGFGRALATGDFNKDNIADLAIGVPGWDGEGGGGAVIIIHGSPNGLGTAKRLVLTPLKVQPEGNNDNWNKSFGSALVARDFNHDGFDDLAIGAPGSRYPNGGSDFGSVFVAYGTAAGLSSAGQRWNKASPGIEGDVQIQDHFGTSLASGDFNGDKFADLAIGVRGRDSYGAVYVLYGGASGLSAAGSQLWTQDSPEILGERQKYGRFGEALAAGNFRNGPYDDLAIGSPGMDVNGVSRAGTVNVLYGSNSGLKSAGNQLWYQDKEDLFGEVANAPEENDAFGAALAIGDFDGDGYAELAIGAPGEDFNNELLSAGAIHILHGAAYGLTTQGNRILWQFTFDPEAETAGDGFGKSLVALNAGGTSHADLIVGLPADEVNTAAEAGSVLVIYGSPSGLTVSGARRLIQESLDVSDAGDHFGASLAQ